MEEKELEIIVKSAEVFMRYGVKAVTMDDLARELSISKKTIYKYFEDKKALVRAIVQERVNFDKHICLSLQNQTENAIDELIQLSKIINDNFGNIHTSVFFDLKKYHADAWEILENHKKDFVRLQIIDNIERGIKEGLYRDNLNTAIIAQVYIGTVDSIFDQLNTSEMQLSLKDTFIEVIRFLIRGLASDQGFEYLKTRINQEKNV